MNFHDTVGLILIIGLAAACSSDDNVFGASGASGAGGAGAAASTGPLGQGGGGLSSGSGGGGGFDECAAVAAEANAVVLPADIIFAVDTSASMIEEAGQVQANMNLFASSIIESGIDVHVILISDEGQGQNQGPPQPYEICIPPPLGNGADANGFCAGMDEDLPRYRHVVESVTSSDALDVIVETYEQYQAQLRPNAIKYVVVVSDDDSGTTAAEFTAAMTALDPPMFSKMVFHGIAADEGPAACLAACGGNCAACGACCSDCNAISAADGAVYKQLAMQTNGIFEDLCIQNFASVFSAMGKAVVGGASVPCEYPIPDPPPGQKLDPALVNVKYFAGGKPPGVAIPRVNNAGECGPKGGWYYNDHASPTKIVACPVTCSTLQMDPDAKVDVLFGCESKFIPPPK